MLKKILNGIMAIAVCVVGLSGCGESQTEEVEMPEIVFVASFHYPGVKDYLTGTFRGTAGYCVDKNGNIKYFEFEYPNDPAYDYEKECITIAEYSEMRKLSEFHKNVKASTIDTNFSAISQEDLSNYYKTSKKIKNKSKLQKAYTYIYHQGGGLRIYGVRKNADNIEEYVLIHESWTEFYYNKDNHAEKLYNSEFRDCFPVLSSTTFLNMDDKLNTKGEIK